jgi:ribosomal protein S18 acetylase RimI-like enzyme
MIDRTVPGLRAEVKPVGGLAHRRPRWGTVTDVEDLLLAYDRQLRTGAETQSAIAVTRFGSLRLATFAGGRGFVTYPHLYGAEAEHLPQLVAQVLDHYRQDPEVTRIEWKTRGHDGIPELHERLLANGFKPEEPESIMIGRAQLLDVDVPLPAGVTLHQVRDADDVRAMAVMQDTVFKSTIAHETVLALLRRLALDDGTELWVAEARGKIVAAGRLEPVAGTDFAGLWGGATLEAWRGQGIYRALTAARARSALAAGKTLIHSDSTEYSRPILERSGFVKVSTTTPYLWSR